MCCGKVVVKMEEAPQPMDVVVRGKRLQFKFDQGARVRFLTQESLVADKPHIEYYGRYQGMFMSLDMGISLPMFVFIVDKIDAGGPQPREPSEPFIKMVPLTALLWIDVLEYREIRESDVAHLRPPVQDGKGYV
jgi:hypothetical protein